MVDWVSRIRFERALEELQRPDPTAPFVPVIPGRPFTIKAPCQPIGCDGGYHLVGCELEGIGA